MRPLPIFLVLFVLVLTAHSQAAGLTSLMTAAANGDLATARALLKTKSDVNAREDEEKRTALYFAISNENQDVANLLIDKGADLENLRQEGESALFLATTTNNHALMKRVLAKKKKLLNTPDADGTTPLMEAAKYGNKETLQILLKAGADQTLKNKHGQTALEVATENKNEAAVALLSKSKKK